MLKNVFFDLQIYWNVYEILLVESKFDNIPNFTGENFNTAAK